MAMSSDNITVDPFSVSPRPNQSSCDVFAGQAVATVLFPIVYLLVFLISACGNSLVLYVICRSQQKCNSTSIYLLNLALSDTLFTLVLPARITYYIRGFDWPFGDVMCTLTAVIFFANTYAGIGFMTCISVDRYLAMVHPHRLRGLRSVKVVRRVCGLVWAIVLLEVASVLFKSMLTTTEGKRTCMEFSNFGARSMLYLLLLACVFSFFLPLALILGCYAQINRKLRSAARQSPLGSGAGGGVGHRRANTIILLILLTFTVSFGPYHVNIMQFMARSLLAEPPCQEKSDFKASLQVTVLLMNLNCALDPILYFFAIKTYKKRVMSLFKGNKLTSSDLHLKVRQKSSSIT
ncbi:G-protein coupled receptor 183 [Gadus chalcogrammus]|uniref:G-protein coupled receptor 183 n=1 Tax=Gadus chalcogrammus TaxID=1042646 RepID=UPI0024C48B9B|nr:G-protein coupled receptor 183 [Gadus chalcogrammus]